MRQVLFKQLFLIPYSRPSVILLPFAPKTFEDFDSRELAHSTREVWNDSSSTRTEFIATYLRINKPSPNIIRPLFSDKFDVEHFLVEIGGLAGDLTNCTF